MGGQGGELARRLKPGDAVVIGLGSMIGAGVFAAFGPAAAAAGSGLLVGLALAALVAYCNAAASAELAAVHPQSGGTYVYGRAQLGSFWGYLAGWAFVVGKTASCAAMALTFGAYAWPGFERPVAVATVVALVAVNSAGVRKTAGLTKVIVVIVLSVLALVVLGALLGGTGEAAHLQMPLVAGFGGILEAAGLLFFAFAGYARIATLGEEVVEPERTIPQAIPIALGLTLVVYSLVAVAALYAVGPTVLAGSSAPLAEAVSGGTWAAVAPLVRVGAAVAAAGVLLSLLVGVSRTGLAMARNRELPGFLAAVHPRFHTPMRAEFAVGAVVVILVLVADLRGAIGFSSFAVLMYYAIANASALTLTADQRRWPPAVPVVGLAGCGLLAVSLPPAPVGAGAGVLAAGAAVWLVLHRGRSA